MMTDSAITASSSLNPDGEPRVKKLRSESGEGSRTDQQTLDQDSSVAVRESVVRPTLARENSSKLSVVLKPPTAAIASVVVQAPEVIRENISREAIIRDKELARWSANYVDKMPKYTPSILSDDAIIRRKLMFEAGNPPASSHRGIKLLSGNVGVLVKSVKDLRPEEEIAAAAQRVQLYLGQEELTLTRLTVACESMRKISENEANFPLHLQTALVDVEAQMKDQRRRLDEANKADLLFAGYVESANRIRKLEPYDELLKTRNKLKEDTKKLKEEKTKLDRQQAEKLPFLLIANWALRNLRSGEGASPNLPAAALGSLHHSKSANKHRKSPKKSSKEPKSS